MPLELKIWSGKHWNSFRYLHTYLMLQNYVGILNCLKNSGDFLVKKKYFGTFLSMRVWFLHTSYGALGPCYLLPPLWLNTSYLTDSYVGFALKMESVSQITIFRLKMIVKSGLDKVILESLNPGRYLFFYWICDFGHFYEVRESSFPHGGISKIFFVDLFSPSFIGRKFILKSLHAGR